ncbi:MAG: tyrosine-type recombinase/integrase [Lachnospiraceae bacterium]|nr:tyrosine-type recombinase/integrase [Lachnospiraceae bacterium]
MQTKLMKLEYFDEKAETRLEVYADTVVLEKEGNVSYIAAVRFGGYPESVRGMSDAVYGGGSITAEIDGKPLVLYSRMKQYRRELSHDGIYAEATLIIRDEEISTGSDGEENAGADRSGGPRKCYLFCEAGDSGRLFEELDKKTGVPLMPSAVNNVIYNVADKYNKEEVAKAKKEHRKAELLPRISAHNLRHTACTNMAKQGMNVKVLQYIMGHAHSDVTMDVYNHIANKQDIREEVESYARVAGI